MKMNQRTKIIRIIAFLLVVVFAIPINASATTVNNIDQRASHYLTSYNTYLYRGAFGKIQVWFTVTGVDYMDDIGVLRVQIYESKDGETWTWVETYNHDTTSGMLGNDKIYHSGHVDYSGTIGRYYKAYVTIWAGKDGDGDTRYMWTDIQKATLLPG